MFPYTELKSFPFILAFFLSSFINSIGFYTTRHYSLSNVELYLLVGELSFKEDKIPLVFLS